MQGGYSKVGRSSIWDNPQLESALRRHWDAGLSCSLIAAALRAELGVAFTRSAIIGKVHRLKLEPRRTAYDGRRQRARVAGPKKAPNTLRWRGGSHASRMKAKRELVLTLGQALKTFDTYYDDSYSPPEGRVTLLDLRPRQCRWPYGDGDFMFCGKPADGSYCRYHANVSAYGIRGAAVLICEAAE